MSNKRTDQGPLLTVDDVAALLSVSVKTVDGWMCEKRTPHLKPSRSILRFRRSDIESCLDERAVPALGMNTAEHISGPERNGR